MDRRTYYFIIGVFLSIIFLYTSFYIFILKGLSTPKVSTAPFKNLIALFIIIYETIHAKKIIRRISFSVLFFTIIGFLFTIQHWPYGREMLFGSLITILLLLIINAIISKDSRLNKIVILFYPLLHIIGLAGAMYHLPFNWWMFDICLVGVTAAFVWVRLLQRSN